MKNLHKCPGESLEGAFLALEAKREENTERKDYLPSEALGLAKRLEPLEREAAKRPEDVKRSLQEINSHRVSLTGQDSLRAKSTSRAWKSGFGNRAMPSTSWEPA